jgi:hypothetical protein
MVGRVAPHERLDGRLHRVTNEEIDEIWTAVTDGTPIEIRP